MTAASAIQSVEAEAGVVATVLLKPDYVFFSEHLTPHHFADERNAYIYYAVRELARRGISTIDAYNITNLWNAREDTKPYAEAVSIGALNEMFDVAPIIARQSSGEYKLLVDQVFDSAFRRDALKKLQECEALCLRQDESETIQTRIYREIEGLISSYQNLDEVVPLGERIDGIWAEIQQGQDSDSFTEFPFPALNEYVKLSRTDAIVLAAREKRGKSLFLLNVAVDLLRKGKRVLVIDTELDTKLYVMRLICHLAHVRFVRLRDGVYDAEEEKRIGEAIAWLRGQNFCHVYRPQIDEDQLISITKKYLHTHGLDCLILDYLKGNNEKTYLDAFQNSATLGKITDTLKNLLAGELGLFVLTAVQATNYGSIADSAKIIRNCSTLLYLERKTQEQFDNDGGAEYGNMTLNVRANRNGMIMGDDEYISLTLDGDYCTFTEAKQPERSEPF
jgi:replicative DNA helicase